MMKILWRIITPIISAVLGIFAANRLNIFDFLSFVPDEYAYEICITAYFAIADILIKTMQDNVFKWIKNKFLSEIEVIIFQQGTNLCVDTDSILKFNADDLTQANILVKIKGRKKHFNGIDLIVKKPSFAEIQSTYNRPEVMVDRENYRIKLMELFGNSDTLDGSQTFKIAMIKDPVDGDISITLSPELSKKRCNLRYRHNNAQLKAVGK